MSTNKLNENATRDYVYEYVQAGYSLIPLNGKVPLKSNWQNTPHDPLLTREDFKSNYGIVLDHDDLIIDIDPRNFKDAGVIKSLEENINWSLCDTMIVQTGSGGYHIYYKKPEKLNIRETLPEFPGIEFKTKGRQVVGIGSIHPNTGKKYELYMNSFSDIKQAPESLLKLIKISESALTTGIETCEDSESSIKRFMIYLENTRGAIQGQGGDTETYKVACKGKEYGLSPRKTFELMLKHWNSKCVPIWTPDELQRKVMNAYTYSQNALGCNTPEADFKYLTGIDFECEEEKESWLTKYLPDISQFKIGIKYENFCSIADYIRFNKIIAFQNRYVYVWTKEDKKDKNYLNFQILSNYVIKPQRSIIDIDEDGEDTHNIEIIVRDFKGCESKPVIFDSESKVNPKKAGISIAKKGNYIDVFSEQQFKQVIYEIYRDNNLPNKYIYQTPGAIKNRNLWLYADSAMDFKTGDILPALNGVVKINDNTEVTLGKELHDRPYLNYRNYINTKYLAEKLLINILEAYNCTIEPFLVLGAAIMSPFTDLFFKEIGGFPIVWSYGLSGGGKSNLFDIITCLYGFNKGFSQSGSTTINKIWQTISKYNHIPVMFEETNNTITKEGRFENDIKCWYDRKKRGRMLNGQREANQNVNATVMFSSNNLPPQKDAVLNRLIFCIFRPDNFNVDKAKLFNETRDNELSNLLPEILKTPKEKILVMFNSFKDLISTHKSLDARSVNNIAIALTGAKLLFELVQLEEPQELKNSLGQYLNNHKEVYQTENALDIFLEYLIILKNSYKIRKGEQYEVNIKENSLKIDCKAIHPIFAKEYKLVTGSPAPTEKEILYCAEQDKRIIKSNGKTTKNLWINKQQTRGIEIDISSMKRLESLDSTDYSY